MGYLRGPHLFEQLCIARGDGGSTKLMKKLAKTDLLILYERGIQKRNAPQRNDLLELIEDRNSFSPSLITSQLLMEPWHDFIGEATLADAICSKFCHNANGPPLKGESMQRKART